MTSLYEYIPLVVILAYIPYVCYMDWKYREVPLRTWIPIVAINFIMLYQYLIESPARNYYLLALSCGLCIILLVLSAFKAIAGADVIFGSIILITFQYSPLVFPREFFPLDFFWNLCLTTVYLPVLIYFYNLRKGNKYSIVNMFTKFPRGIPFMIPISFAFIATIIIEVLL